MSALPDTLATRDAVAADLDAVASLEDMAFPVPWKREYFASEIGTTHRYNRVAIDSRGDLVGYVFCAYAGGELHVNKIAVSPGWRRLGVGRVLMDEVLAFGRRNRVQEIYLEVRVSNAPAREFYREFGFVEGGRRTAYYLDGEDALVLVLRLDEPSPRRETRLGRLLHKRR